MLVGTPQGVACFRCPLTCPLAVVESCSAEIVKELQLRLSSFTMAGNIFTRLGRACCTDSHSANLLAEKLIAQERTQTRTGSPHIKCDIHKMATVNGQTFSLQPLEPHIRGMIHCALSMRTGGGMERFRTCLKAEVRERLVILRGSCPPGGSGIQAAIGTYVRVAHSKISYENTAAGLVPEWRLAMHQHTILHPCWRRLSI